ncbi:MAG TPA: AMP-binding protein, partial [Candidatus Limnocylindria bacterium]|nr:AMP-binding protein [Candidatus Limnocylindria bacterium]
MERLSLEPQQPGQRLTGDVTPLAPSEGSFTSDPEEALAKDSGSITREKVHLWNQTARDYPLEIPLHHWIQRQIEAHPATVAVRFEGEELSYGELGRRAGLLASYLRRLGSGPGHLVGVYLERSFEMVVALLGILESGAAYVPIDPDYPAERQAFMIDDSGARILLTVERLRGGIPADKAHVVSLDAEWRVIESAPFIDGDDSGAEDLAYVIYTSGSTGRPKGARNIHRGIVNRLLWGQDEYRLTPSDVVLQKTPYSFDISVWEFFWPLMAGARLVLARPGGHREPDYLRDLIRRESISLLHFVPSMLGAFLEEPGVENCVSVRDVLCSGEALPYHLQARFFELLPARLHNLYGPTEAAVEVTYWECQRGGDLKVVPIGRPVANTRCYILDAQMNPVPAGETGELY